jgi:acyl carrier protein
MEHSDILAGIGTSLSEVLKRDASALPEDTRLFEDLHLDSTSILELLMALEDHVGIEIDAESLDMDDFRTIGTLASYLTGVLGVAA